MENIFHCSLTIEKNEQIIEQIKNNIYKIEINDKRGLGLLYKIKFDSKIIHVLITVLNNEDIIQGNNLNTIIIYLKDKEIKIKNPKKKIITKESNILLIEIKPNIDKIEDKYFIEMDDNNINEINSKIYLVNYTKDDISISYGLYSNIKGNNISNIDNNFIFSFIFSIENLRLIGIYKDFKIFNINNKIIKEYYEKNDKSELNELNEITIIYNINKKSYIRLFGEEFVKKNKECKIIINNEENEIDICEKYYLKEEDKKKKELRIKLKGIKTITNMSYMFEKCTELKELPDISKWNTINIKKMECIFSKCESLVSLTEISKWNTINVTNMRFMFSDCKSLKSLPDISQWDISNVSDMRAMFKNCELLESLPDISIWNTINVTDMSYMFSECKSLKSLPDI